ncbi:MAG: MFS transporter [Crocinitomicaceae bacterium TMED209]|jgi:maltose/moltooligosaccharide transporter|nr:MAG: MFS transporter [Crocinitomicaceae bacterium TMED209]RPG88217.1 MAG: MFS transporter [Crocinitomicaceae bacterium TMED209]|tara:strand:- start:4071 stop:5420 length:1350 start_codon:yes stop_codon:yes gene_type:complete
MPQEQKRLSFWQIWNMSFGFLGIQFGFALQGGNMSRIFQTLGASPEELPGLWIAAPLTGLLVQPIIGYWSDRTWSPKWGRRRPYFMIGAVLSSAALFIMPHSSALWMAAGLLWVLDASINISMEPFRALVADKLPEDQRNFGFVLQTLIIGIGTWVASNLPWIVTQLGAKNEAPAGEIPDSVFYSFAVGAAVFLITIIVTVWTTDEEPPEDLAAFEKAKALSAGFLGGAKEILGSIAGMPKVMLQLGVVQFFSWFAFFTMWSFATPALTEHVFASPNPEAGAVNFEVANAAFNEAANAVSSAMGVYGLSSMAFALLLAFYTSRYSINRRLVHGVSLAIGGLGFAWMLQLNPDCAVQLKWCFACIGVAWGSILSMPYAMLSSSVPKDQMGIYMGIFNMFIVIPQILAALGGINWVNGVLFDGNIAFTMMIAGLSLGAGALSLVLVDRSVH